MKNRLSIIFIFNMIVVSICASTIHDYIEQAEESLVFQDYYRAVELYKEALKINPTDISSNKGLSDSFFMLGEYEESLLYIEKSISLDRSNLEFLNSKGRVLTALERYKDAEYVYNDVLKLEMYNIGAQSGLAELRIVNGDLKGSLYDFEKILRFSPNSRRLLLSLVVLNDSQKEFLKSDELIQKAIRFYPQDPIVLEAAVKHYMITKNYSGAAIYMDELIKLSNNVEIKLLHSELLIYLEDYDESLNILTEYMKIEKENPEAFYIASVILDNTNEKVRALSLIGRGIDLKPDEELFRFYSEMIMNDLYLLKADQRSKYSMWYFQQGKLLENRFYYEKAKIYYQRGMDLNPFSKDLRVAYAGILKKMGFAQRYVKELELVLDQDTKDPNIEEILLIEKSLPMKKIYEKWGNEKWNNNNLYSVSTFINNSKGENHLFSSNIIKDVSSRFLSGQSQFFTDKIEVFNGDYSKAFNEARNIDSDYFIILGFFEGSRTFSLQASLHLTSSGREIKSFNYLKTGNNRIFNCFENFSKDLNAFFPIIGSVIDIKGNNVLLNIGKQHNISLDEKFNIVKKGSLELIPSPPFITFNKDQHLGTVIITDIGEAMSEGLFTPNSSFNLLNIGDNVTIFNTAVNEDETINDENMIISDAELIQQLLQVN